VARAFLDGTAQAIFGGTTEIMKEIIGRGLGVQAGRPNARRRTPR
jgi:alkylation response protein AidB-like acyl-CoA dehydrogenase